MHDTLCLLTTAFGATRPSGPRRDRGQERGGPFREAGGPKGGHQWSEAPPPPQPEGYRNVDAGQEISEVGLGKRAGHRPYPAGWNSDMIATTSSASSAGARPDPAPPRGGGRAGGSAGPRRSPRRRHRHAGRPALGCPARRLLLGINTQPSSPHRSRRRRRRFSEECSAPNCSRSTGAWGRTTSWRSCLRRDARLHRSGLRRQVPAPHRADLPRDSGCASTTDDRAGGEVSAGRERSGAAARNGPALCRGFSRLVWDVGVGAQRKAAL